MTFYEFSEKIKQENWFKGKPRINPRATHPKFGRYHSILMAKHGGDEVLANSEFDELVKTPAGQYKMLKGSHDSQIHKDKTDIIDHGWRAKHKSADAMFRNN